MKQLRLFTIAAALGIFCGNASASLITPASYAYTNSTPGGEATYTDPSGTLLTDGIPGSNNILDGTWVLWQSTPSPEITFTFASVVTIDLVGIDQIVDSEAATFLPEFVSIDSGSVTPDNSLPAVDPTSGFLNYTGSWTGQTLVLDLGHDTGHWIGISQVEFDSASTAPEPSSLILAGLALIAIGGIRSRRQSRNKVA